MEDQHGMRAIGVAVAAVALDPYPPQGFHRGERSEGFPSGL